MPNVGEQYERGHGQSMERLVRRDRRPCEAAVPGT